MMALNKKKKFMDSHNKNNFKDNPELKILCMAPKKFFVDGPYQMI